MDWAAYHRLVRRACFVCELLAGNPEYPHQVVYRDGVAVAFLNRFPVWPGHVEAGSYDAELVAFGVGHDHVVEHAAGFVEVFDRGAGGDEAVDDVLDPAAA
jgi:hypothetical protein